MKKSGYLILIPGLWVLLLLVQQCKHEPILRVKTSSHDTISTPPVPEDTTICFERDILPLIRSNCAKSGCHDSATHTEGLRLNTYNGIRYSKDNGIIPGNPNASNLYRNIVNGYMNSPGSQYGNLSASQIALIKRWISEGAQNGTNCPSKCDTTKYTFSGAINPLLQKYCTGCHTGPAPGGGYSLDSYTGVKAVVDNGKLWGAINGNTGYKFMPQGGSKLNTCQLRQVEKWIQNGAQNN